MRSLRTLVLSSRPLSWVNTAVPFALAYYVVTESFDPIFVVGSIFFLIPYNFLMYASTMSSITNRTFAIRARGVLRERCYLRICTARRWLQVSR